MPPLNRHHEDDVGVSSSASSSSSSHSLYHPAPIDSPTSSCINLNDFDRSVDKFAQGFRGGPKKVIIQEQVTIQYIPRHNDWSIEERRNRYYTQEEYFEFKRDVFTTLFYIRNYPDRLDNVLYTGRGVECRDPTIAAKRQQVKQLAWSVVFDEQRQRSCQGEEGQPHDDSCMATMYSNATKPALSEALYLAASDELEVATCCRLDGDENHHYGRSNDGFSDDWISSISLSLSNLSLSRSSTAAFECSYEDDNDCGFAVFGEPTGFDDSWIRGD
jgi:hypothetical protein